ncbi:hypothetical protein GH5_07057 [Leishmania sp. Ghana 2012 LV757]|uniref:hypothetical protein n=1 Tax=Leishmania sp. Ghana 2012 LV757 TaxID=2803181 RepID=UPI001B700E51|nr:hypothetical protein GH5_07057 [Leishmania sp. Ghana 2012 LV757]
MSLKHLVCHFFFLWRVPDYLAIVIIGLVAALVGSKVRPHCRDVDWNDPSIGHPFATREVFPMYSVVVAVIMVGVLYIFGELWLRRSRPAGKLSMYLHINGWVLAHAWSIALAFALVNLSKLYAGRLRPDFLSRLEKEGITETSWATMTHDAQCQVAREGRLSFPSGHSGTAFSGYVPPCMYLMGLFRTLNGGRLWLVTVSLLPLLLPIAIAISRTIDQRHNFDDILAGSICGSLCGVLSVVMSFRPSIHGQWTLRDHPDDEAESQVRLGCRVMEGGEAVNVSESLTAERDSSMPRLPMSSSRHHHRQELVGIAVSSPRDKHVSSPGAAVDAVALSRGSFA